MFIQLQPQYFTIWELELELFAIEHRIILVDDAMVIGTDDNDVRGVVIQQRSVHRFLQYESIVVIHQSYILFFCLLLTVFFPYRETIERLFYVLVSTFERRRNDLATIHLGHASNAPVCLTCICSVRHLVSLCFLLC